MDLNQTAEIKQLKAGPLQVLSRNLRFDLHETWAVIWAETKKTKLFNYYSKTKGIYLELSL